MKNGVIRCLVALPSIVLLSCTPEREIIEHTCDVSGSSYVTIGGTTYEISSSLSGAYIRTKNGFGRTYPNLEKWEYPYTKICPLPETNRFDANQLAISSPARTDLKPTHLPVAVDILIDPPRETSKDMYETRDFTQGDGYPIEGGFIAPDISVGLGGQSYVQSEPSVFTPSGNPVVFRCYRESKRHDGNKCFTWWIDTGGNVISIEFDDVSYPPTEWREMYTEATRYLDSIRLDTDGN